MLRRFLKGGDSTSLLSAERLMVLVIIGLSVTLVVFEFAHIQQRNRDQARRADLYNLQLSIQKFYALNGYYPAKLLDAPALLPQYCQDPLAGGDCERPAYGYVAFSAQVVPGINKPSDCDNKKTICVKYILFSNNMESSANPFTLSSY